jgi:hypothetical protein
MRQKSWIYAYEDGSDEKQPIETPLETIDHQKKPESTLSRLMQYDRQRAARRFREVFYEDGLK